MLLYLTSNQKSSLIDAAVRNMTLPAKKLVGRFSLKSFVTKDMRNYANAKFFVVDAACIEESGNDFTLALQSFQMMFSARIIVILSGCEDVNGEVQRLLSIGVVNLVTGETMEDALDELTEALSEDGMQRYVVKAPVYEQPVTRREKTPEPDEIIPYRWNARNIRIAVAGSQRRSGVTVTAFNLASWLAARGAEVAYIEVNQNRHLQLLLNIYEAAPDGEHYTIDGIDCYLTNEPDKEYQFIIYDCGVMQMPTSIFRDTDHRLLCGSVLPYEIPVFHKAYLNIQRLLRTVLITSSTRILSYFFLLHRSADRNRSTSFICKVDCGQFHISEGTPAICNNYILMNSRTGIPIRTEPNNRYRMPLTFGAIIGCYRNSKLQNTALACLNSAFIGLVCGAGNRCIRTIRLS